METDAKDTQGKIFSLQYLNKVCLYATHLHDFCKVWAVIYPCLVFSFTLLRCASWVRDSIWIRTDDAYAVSKNVYRNEYMCV